MTKDHQDLRTRLGDVFFFREALRAGLSSRRLYRMRDDGTLTTVGVGLYRWSDAPLANLDHIEIAERAPRSALCLETALVHHDLLDVIPAEMDIAIPRGTTRPRLQVAHRLHHFDPKTFDIGRETVEVSSRRALGIYSAERSIIDMIRLRHDQGTDQVWEALRRWLSKRGNGPGQLLELANHFRGVESVLRSAFEILL